MADLGEEMTISFVKTYGRTDCCTAESASFTVHVGNDKGDMRKNTQCGGMINGGGVAHCNAKGRYVGVYKGSHLSLAEIEAYVQPASTYPTNLLYHKPAYQFEDTGSTYLTSASTGVDGNTSGEYFDGGMLYTSYWWYADMGSTKDIKTVVVYGRTTCCQTESNDYFVMIGDNTDPLKNRACQGKHSGSQTILCELSGRYVGIFKPGHFAIAEVEAYDTYLY